MYITWKYDLFPFELCGRVIESKGNNFYEVEGYEGMKSEAKRRIEDDALGATIKGMLAKFTEQHRKDLAFLNERHREHVAFMMTYMVGIK